MTAIVFLFIYYGSDHSLFRIATFSSMEECEDAGKKIKVSKIDHKYCYKIEAGCK